MRRMVGDKPVHCELNAECSHERLVGVCFLLDGTDIGAEHPSRPGAGLRALGLTDRIGDSNWTACAN
jgi:hypothetical protein